ncbi:hypothetical protein OAory_01105880 [Aspergillus oryzae]|uniref:Uncharacterized protein n=1 Tax=Aspergillus oryzae TaxID=5062 RepID=A0A1S9DJQ2_ASPOZ|nr:hypothetical protein OAory_01105880 [Aspergillus oryzae]
MVTWMKEQDNIDVHFGFDVNMGYFLIVYDMRLAAYIPDGTEFDDVRYAVSADGTGAYFTAYTGTHRQGRRVSVETMRESSGGLMASMKKRCDGGDEWSAGADLSA